MAVFRIEKTRDYTVMSNHHLRNKSLSLKAKGLQSLMLSLPENWDFTLAGLAYICQDGIGSVRSGVAELEKQGYLTRRRIREANGQLGDIEYTIHEIPRKPNAMDKSNPSPSMKTPVDKPVENPVDNSPPVCDKPTFQKPICENPTLVIPTYENRTQLNINSNQIKKKLITNSSNNHQSIYPDARDRQAAQDVNERMDAMDVYREVLKKNIGFDYLCARFSHRAEEIEELLELMLEAVCSTKKTMRICGDEKPAEIVKSRMMKLDQSHIEYVLDTFAKNTTDVRNIKNYMLTALYNATLTIDTHYRSRVNHDFCGDK